MTWRTDAELTEIARELGAAMAHMLELDQRGPLGDTPLVPGGSPSPNLGATIMESMALDARDFMSLDPQKITDEYNRMTRAATASAGADTVRSGLDAGLARLAANWHGDAAEAFTFQMGYIKRFLERQEATLLVAAQGMGTAFALSVSMRQSFYDLAENTAVACDAVSDKKQSADGGSSFEVSSGVEVVKNCVKLFDIDSIKKMKGWAVDRFFDALTGVTKKEKVDDSGAQAVVDSYLRSRDQLRRSYQDGLNQLRDWLGERKWDYLGTPSQLLDPLPACADVHSPDFSYSQFFDDHHDPTLFSPRVEQEREKAATGNPHGLISATLEGNP